MGGQFYDMPRSYLYVQPALHLALRPQVPGLVRFCSQWIFYQYDTILDQTVPWDFMASLSFHTWRAGLMQLG